MPREEWLGYPDMCGSQKLKCQRSRVSLKEGNTQIDGLLGLKSRQSIPATIRKEHEAES